jgi:hypothetical protein
MRPSGGKLNEAAAAALSMVTLTMSTMGWPTKETGTSAFL